MKNQIKASLPELSHWIDEVASHTNPDKIHLCDGSEDEYQLLIGQMKITGDLIELDKVYNQHVFQSKIQNKK